MKKHARQHGLRDGVLHVDESRIRSMSDVDKLRGIQADSVNRFRSDDLKPDLRQYLDLVLSVTMKDIQDREQAKGCLPHAVEVVETLGPQAHPFLLPDEAEESPITKTLSHLRAKQEAHERQQFIDAAAIGLYANGAPIITVFRKATELWTARQAWLKQQNGG